MARVRFSYHLHIGFLSATPSRAKEPHYAVAIATAVAITFSTLRTDSSQGLSRLSYQILLSLPCRFAARPQWGTLSTVTTSISKSRREISKKTAFYEL
jgi:hypothetical protein